MKKDLQIQINACCTTMMDLVNDELHKEDINNTKRWKKLRSCQAEVLETENFYVLRSYRTLVAFIDKKTDTLYDVLRIVYGYTSTSAQHISKFSKDYGGGKWGCADRMIAR